MREGDFGLFRFGRELDAENGFGSFRSFGGSVACDPSHLDQFVFNEIEEAAVVGMAAPVVAVVEEVRAARFGCES